MYYGTDEPYFAVSAPRTAEIARKNGIDAEAQAVKGDHGSAADKSLLLAIEFFKKMQ